MITAFLLGSNVVDASEVISGAYQARSRTALKWAQDVLWEWGPDTGGASDDRTLAVLLLIFRDPELVKASEASEHPLAAAVRDIRAILARQDRDPLLPSRHIINALCEESAIDAPWLYAALASPTIALCSSALGQVDHQTFKPHGLFFVDFDLAPRERSRRR